MAILELRDITKAYHTTVALDQVNLQLAPDQILCILGPSGCGKTTLLRVTAGLERPDSGTVKCEGSDITATAPHRRNFGMMFQEFALFPHKNVIENVAFGLKLQKLSKQHIRKRCREILAQVGLEGFGERHVGDLSGGERQRVALARSLAPRPRLLMLDEPFNALDRALRERLGIELRRILKKVGMTAIFVTHDHSEAFAIGDVIAVMNKGRIEQMDYPEVLYARPINQVVARFLGYRNFIEGKIVQKGRLHTPVGEFHLQIDPISSGNGVSALIRPDGARIINHQTPIKTNEIALNGLVKDYIFRGKYFNLIIETETGDIWTFDLPYGSPSLKLNEKIRLAIDYDHIIVLPQE